MKWLRRANLHWREFIKMTVCTVCLCCEQARKAQAERVSKAVSTWDCAHRGDGMHSRHAALRELQWHHSDEWVTACSSLKSHLQGLVPGMVSQPDSPRLTWPAPLAVEIRSRHSPKGISESSTLADLVCDATPLDLYQAKNSSVFIWIWTGSDRGVGFREELPGWAVTVEV